MALVPVMLFAQAAWAGASLGEADANKLPHARVGDSLRLKLPENPSTGYRWALEFSPPDAIAVTKDVWVAASDLVGAPGLRQFVIRVRHAGHLSIRAKHWRQWEGDASAIKRLEFQIEARR